MGDIGPGTKFGIDVPQGSGSTIVRAAPYGVGVVGTAGCARAVPPPKTLAANAMPQYHRFRMIRVPQQLPHTQFRRGRSICSDSSPSFVIGRPAVRLELFVTTA